MTDENHLLTRRAVIITALAAAAGTASLGVAARALAQTGGLEVADGGLRGDSLRNWDWLVGRWTVRHRRLKARLAGSTEWDEFAGTCANWPLLGGQGNVDDNVLELPAGTYRGVGIRAFDADKGQWSIWWLDSRTPKKIDPPVYGTFADGVGTFIGDDSFDGRPIKVRFRWSQITPESAHWDQAFSPDGGETWEPNWHMDFTRAGD